MQDVEEETNFYPVLTKDGRTLIVANLVEDDPEFRSKLRVFTRQTQQERVDVIIALGMAKRVRLTSHVNMQLPWVIEAHNRDNPDHRPSHP